MANHPGPATTPALLSPVLVLMVLMTIAIAMLAKATDMLNHFWLVRAPLVVRLRLVTSYRVSASDMRTGDRPFRQSAASRTSLRVDRGGKVAPTLEGSAVLAVVAIQQH